MPSILSTSLCKIKHSGADSFESLVSSLLEQATGLNFLLARSGDQKGRDGRALNPSNGSIMFECKRYKDTTPLSIRELVAELVQAKNDIPKLDLWIIATTRSIPDQTITDLEKEAENKSIDILGLDCREDSSGLMDCLCANFPKTVIATLNANRVSAKTINEVESQLEAIRKSPGYDLKYSNLEKKVRNPSLGWPSWRKASHNRWSSIVSSENESRSEFGQPLNVLAANSYAIKRKESTQSLDHWWSDWAKNRQFYVLEGEEGDGKSWSVAQWLTNKINTQSDTFPPVIFLASKNSGGNPDILSIIQNGLGKSFPNSNWSDRLLRWVSSTDNRNNTPTAILILDGINERQDPNYWRSVLESHQANNINNSIAVICTTRTLFWNENLQPLNYLNFIKWRLPPFNQEEIVEALALRSLKIESFPDELRPLLCKPRYLDLAIKHHKKLETNGDFTVSRLVYEDWKDRYQRKNSLPISDQSFNDFLRSLAESVKEGKSKFSAQELGHMLPLVRSVNDAVTEISTSGILNKKGHYWIIEPKRLSMGLGLLLCDALKELDSNEHIYLETISSWVEPHTGIDIQSEIIEYALLNSLLNEQNSLLSQALLFAWLTTQNPSQLIPNNSVESRLIAYIPLCPQAYFNLAEKIWRLEHESEWGQDVLMKGFTRWGNNSETFRNHLVGIFGKWLSLIPINGPISRRESGSGKDQTQIEREKLQKTIGKKPVIGPITFQGFNLQLIDNDGHLRLSRFALAVISNIENRSCFIPAIGLGVLAEAISDHPGKEKLFAWTLRLTKISLNKEILSTINALLAIENITCQQATYRLCKYAGIKESISIRKKLDPNKLFPKIAWVEEELKKHIVDSFFACNFMQFQDYINSKNDFKFQSFYRKLDQFTTYPELTISNKLNHLLTGELEAYSKLKVWQDIHNSHDNYLLDEGQNKLIRFLPHEFANLIRAIFKDSDHRPLPALIQLALKLEKYHLILDEECRTKLLSIWDSHKNELIGITPNGKVAEAYLFLGVIPQWDAKQQIEMLRMRPNQFFNLLKLQYIFCSGLNRDDISSIGAEEQWSNILWYLTYTEQPILSNKQLLISLGSQDELVQAFALKYLLLFGTDEEIKDWLDKSSWSWKHNQHKYIQLFGSLLISKVAHKYSFEEALSKTAPYLWEELFNYKHDDLSLLISLLDRTLDLISSSAVADKLPKLSLITQEKSLDLNRASIVNDEDRSIKFISKTSFWGGTKYNSKFPSNLDVDIDAENKKLDIQHNDLQSIIENTYSLGHYWVDEEFSSENISKILSDSPEKIEAWVSRLNTKQPLFLYRTYGFYSAICEAYLRDVNYHAEACQLHSILNKHSPTLNVYILNIHLPKIDWCIFNSVATPHIRILWEEKYEACITDEDIFNLTLLIKHTNNLDALKWVESKIQDELKSDLVFFNARAITFRAFLDPNQNADWFTETLDDEFWLNDVLTYAHQNVRSYNQAKHWFNEFCVSDTDDSAFAAYTLFLKCTDRRCWLWVNEKLSILKEKPKRMIHFRLNQESITKSCKENEKEFKETLFGQKIDSGLHPWM